jgi:hypothetical protein
MGTRPVPVEQLRIRIRPPEVEEPAVFCVDASPYLALDSDVSPCQGSSLHGPVPFPNYRVPQSKFISPRSFENRRNWDSDVTYGCSGSEGDRIERTCPNFFLPPWVIDPNHRQEQLACVYVFPTIHESRERPEVGFVWKTVWNVGVVSVGHLLQRPRGSGTSRPVPLNAPAKQEDMGFQYRRRLGHMGELRRHASSYRSLEEGSTSPPCAQLVTLSFFSRLNLQRTSKTAVLVSVKLKEKLANSSL